MEHKWAIRDIEHGKTYFFETFEEMHTFIMGML